MANDPLKKIQDNILNRLKSTVGLLPAEAIDLFPDPPRKVEVTHPVGNVLLHYNGSGWDRPREFINMTQPGLGSWIVTIIGVSIRDNSSALDLIDAVYAGLTGYSPYNSDDTKQLYPVKDGYLERNERLWMYYIEFRVKSVRHKQ